MTGLAASILGVNGEIVDLSAGTLMMAGSPQVFGVSPVSVGVAAAPALAAGSRRGTTKRAEWPLSLPIMILAETQQGLLEDIERLAVLTDPSRGDCVIMVERPGGERREIVAHYSGGLAVAVESCETTTVLVPLTFRAPHPFWRATTPVYTQINFPVTGSGLSATPFSDPLIPFSDTNTPFNGWASGVEEGTVITTLVNAGSAPSWPLWRFNGPVAGVSCTNLTTGRSWSWTRAPYSELASGETLEVRTVDRSDAVRLTSGENRYRGLSTARDLWPLAPGDNLVLIEVVGAGTQTTASVEFHPEYLTC